MATTATRTNYWFIKTVTSTSPIFNFKFVLEVWIDGIKRATLTQPRNNSNSAHFDLERIIKNYINISNIKALEGSVTGTQYEDIHLIPRNVPNPSAGANNDYVYSRNTNNFKTVTLKFYEDYATTSGGTITRNSSGQADLDYRFINFANDWHDQKTFNDTPFIYTATTYNTGRFLTKLQPKDSNDNFIYHHSGPGDFRTFATINCNALGTSPQVFQYKFYDEEPTAPFYANYRAMTITEDPDTPTDGDSDDRKALLFWAAGYENVKNIKFVSRGGQQLQSTDKYYMVEAVGASAASSGTTDAVNIIPGKLYIIQTAGTTDFTLIGAANNTPGTAFYAEGTATGTGTVFVYDYQARTKAMFFKIDGDCNRFTSETTSRTICWKNKYGVWDYYLFDTRVNESDNVKRSIEYTKNPGTWNAADYEIATNERGRVQKVNGTHGFTASTRFVDETYNDYFKGLLMSNDVKMIIKKEVIENELDGTNSQNEYVVPLIMTSNSINYKTVVNDQLVQYSFNFELSHELKQYI